jgi:DNA-binding MarR family transcriptional regulator
MHNKAENIYSLANDRQSEGWRNTILELESALARLAEEVGASRSNAAPSPKALLQARRLRDRLFDADLFADPAWDILLELYEFHLAQQRIAVSSLCIAAAVPATTALRWIGVLERKGLIARRDDQLDGRRTWIELTESGVTAMQRYFQSLS